LKKNDTEKELIRYKRKWASLKTYLRLMKGTGQPIERVLEFVDLMDSLLMHKDLEEMGEVEL